MEVPDETLDQMRTIKSALDDLEEHMQPFLEAAPKDITSQLTALERVKVHLALAQAVVVLYQLHRKLDAAKLDNHPLQKELERLAAYEVKVKKAITADDLARLRPGTSLNIAAANRFIDAAIPDLTPQQKQQLRDLGKREQAAAAAAAGGKGGSSRSRSSGSSKRRQQEQLPDEEQQQQEQQELEGNRVDASVQKEVHKKQRKQHHGEHKAAVAEQAQEFLQEVLADLDEKEG